MVLVPGLWQPWKSQVSPPAYLGLLQLDYGDSCPVITVPLFCFVFSGIRLQSHNLIPLGSWVSLLSPATKTICFWKVVPPNTWILHDNFYWHYKTADLLKASCFWRSVWPVIWLKFTLMFVIYFYFTPLFPLWISHEPLPGKQGDQSNPDSHNGIPGERQEPWCLLSIPPPWGRTCLSGQPGLPLPLYSQSPPSQTHTNWASHMQKHLWVLLPRAEWNPQASSCEMSESMLKTKLRLKSMLILQRH